MKAIFGSITALAIRFRYLTLILVVVLMALGVNAWTTQKQELLPPIEFPQTFILAQASGMTSDEVLEILTKRIEAGLVTIPEIINLESTTTSTIGAFITAANDFGQDQEQLRADIQTAIDNVWLPKRVLQAPAGENVNAFSAQLLGELPAEVLIYIAEQDSNFLFQLTPEVWQALNEDAVRQAIAYLAGQVDQTTDAKNALELLVNKEIVPQLGGLADVANVSVGGGQDLPEELAGTEVEATPAPTSETAPESLLLRLSPKVWDVLSARLNLGELNNDAVQAVSSVAYTIPTTIPALPESWQLTGDGNPTRFSTAEDVLESATLTTPVARVLNNFYTSGRIVSALTQTNDLTLDDVQRMLEIAPSMAKYFTGEQLVALPTDIRDLLIANGAVVDTFAQEGLAALQLAETLTGEASVPTPVDLPSQWRIAYPQLISFSFADLPLVTYSVSSTGEIVIPTDETVTPTEPVVTENPFADENAPALPPLWAIVAGQFSAQAGTTLTFNNAADLLNPAIGGFPELINTVIDLPQVGDALKPLLASITPEVANYLLDKQPDFFNRMTFSALSALSDEVKAIESIADSIAYKSVPALTSVWNTLASQPQFATNPLINGADIVRLGDGKASTALNTIFETLETTYPDYARRLFSNLSPEIVRYWAGEEADFYADVNKGILEEFNPATLEIISQDEAFSAVYDADAIAEIITIATANMPVVVSTTEVGPALNPEWATIAPFYNLTLDTADDLIFAEPLPGPVPITNAGGFINSLYNNAQGANFARTVLANLPEDAFNFILENDPTAFDNLIGRAVRDFPANLLGLLSEEVQARANEIEFVPDTQITRTSGNPSLFVTVSKGSDSNTVTTFKEVDEIMQQLDAANPNIATSIVFEQSTIVEESINGVARDGSLGALFAIIIILIFLGGPEWGVSGRRITGIALIIGSIGGFIGLLAIGLADAGNDWGQAFSNADPVLRVLLFLGFFAGLFILFSRGTLPKPSWRTTLVIAVSIPLSIMIALVGMTWVSPALREVFLPLAENEGALQDLFKFVLNLFPAELTLNIMTLSGLTVAVGRVVDDSIVVLENIFNQLKNGGDKKKVIIQGTKEVSAAIFTATLIALVVFLPLGLTGGIIGAFFMPFGLAVTYALIGSFMVAITVIPVLAFFLIGPNDTPDEDAPFWLSKFYLPPLKWALSGPVSKAIIIFGALLSIAFAGYLFIQRPFAFIPDFGEQQITISVNLDQSVKILETNELVAQFEDYLVTDSPLPVEVVKNVQVTVGGGGADFSSLIGGNTVNEYQANISILLDLQPGEADVYIDDIRANAERIFGGPEFVTVSSGSASSGGFGGLSVVVSGNPEELAVLNPIIIETMNGIEGIANVTSNFVDPNTAGDTPATYIRINQQTAFSYSGELETENTIGVQQLAVDAIKALPEVANNPNISVSRGFQSELQAAGFLSLFSAMGIAIIIMTVLLILSVQSFTYWLAIIFAIVVAPVGAAIGLTLADRVLGIPALTGILMLFGLVISNAVVLIDRVRANLTERNMPVKEALIEAGGRRLRPIIMTSLTTIIGLVPLAVGLSDGAIIAAELGIVVIGGVISSTLLTLIVTPVMFSLLHPLHKILSIRRGKSATLAPQPTGD